MNRHVFRDEDELLRAWFSRQVLQTPDNGFSDKVVRKVRRRIWLRRGILSVAVAAGIFLAWLPLSQLAILIGDGLLALDYQFWIPAVEVELTPLHVSAILASLAPLAIPLLED